MNIAGREIGNGQPPFVVAEIGASHGGNLDEALALIRAAKVAGADSVKFQCYEPDTITIDCDKSDFVMADGPWKGRKLYELYEKAHTPPEWFPSLFRVAREYGIVAFSSVFDKSSIDMLEALDCPAYKIASFEIVDIPVIKYAAATGKPLIISTGMASNDEIDAAMCCVRAGDIAFLHCVSGYPSSIMEANLCRMEGMSGISDHTLGWEVPVAATVLGAQIIEKHFCFSRLSSSEDAAFSLEPGEFKQMCDAVRAIWAAMQPSEAKSEEPQRQARRSLYVVEDMKAGDVFTEQNVRSIRPGYGMAPKMLPDVLGRRASRQIGYGSRLQQDMIE